MDKLVVLELEGEFNIAGFRATLEIRTEQHQVLKVKGSLPAAPEVATQIQRHWHQTYRSLGLSARIKGQKIIHKGSLNRRIVECRQSAEVLRQSFRAWLNSESFQSIDRRLREAFHRDDVIRFLIRTDDLHLQKLPWHEWDFFERYPKAEVALSAPEYEAIPRDPRVQPKESVRVLAILGNSYGIQLDRDRAILEQLPHAEVEFLVEPDRQQFSERLWQEAWDILFFAGHSATEGETGRLYINATDSFTLTELKYGLRHAIDRGLQLAIFNSCDGLGLVQELQQLRIPQLIVMREPIPDPVAALFLQYFLEAFSAGESLYLAERQARERLQGLEHQFPCASWLPIIYQDPLVTPPDWLTLRGQTTPTTPEIPRPKRRHWRIATVVWISLLTTLLVMGIRSTGLLQASELSAYDSLMRSRPAEAIDPRILVVEVTQADVNQLGGYPLTDAMLVKTISVLQSFQPAAIAIDMHRFQPRGDGRKALIAQFQQNSRLLTVCAFNQSEQNYAAPPEFSSQQQIEQLGFSNLILDSLGRSHPLSRNDLQEGQSEGQIVRRQLLSYSPKLAPTQSACATPYSLSFQLAYRFLHQAGVRPIQVTADRLWQFGSVIFQPLPSRFGGYPTLEQANQVMLNYRTAPPGQRVSLQAVLGGKITEEMVRDRIVLVGYTAPVARDTFKTPYGEMAGVWIHAHMVSQLLTSVLEKRSQIWAFPQWHRLQLGDALWILVWSFVVTTGVSLLRSRPVFLGMMIVLLLGCIFQLCLNVLNQGGWLPLVPTLLAVLIAATSTVFCSRFNRR